MKISEKICFMILTGISIFLIGIYDAKAETITADYGLNSTGLISSTNNYNVVNINYLPGNLFANKSGELVFTFYYAIDTSGGELPFEVYVSTNNQVFECSIGSYIFSNNNSNQRATITAICNVNFDSSGWKYIGINTRGTGTKFFLFSQYATISSTSGGASGDISNQLQSIYNRLDTIGNDLYTIQEYYYRNINTTLTNLYNLISQNNTTIQNIETKLNEDIDTESKTPPNQDEYNNAKQKENTIIQGISGASPNDITFTQDINATSTIWNLIDNIVKTNTKIIGLIISILSIGLIKLILAR